MTVENRLDSYYLHKNPADSYENLFENFEWEFPDEFNVATYVCDRWADSGNSIAMYAEDTDGNERTFTYRELESVTNQFANALANRGIERGDRVGVNTPQNPETLIAHLAVWKLGAVSVPLSTLLGPDGLDYRLGDSEARACVVDESCVDVLREADPATLETVFTVGDVDQRDGERDLWTTIEDYAPEFDVRTTAPDDGAMIIYTSGTTGDPKGVLHGHQVVLGHLPFYILCYNNLELTDRTLFWTPVEWSWVGSLVSGILPTLFFGKSVLAYERASFDPEAAFELVDRYSVTNYGGPPTTLRMMMQVDEPAERYDLESMRVVLSGGESVGQDIIDWATETFGGAAVHEGFGQTEANTLVGDCTALFPFKEGTMGKPIPGHDVAIVDQETHEPIEEPGTAGEIAVEYDGDPVCFTEYWNEPEKTDEKVRNGRLLTEDLGSMDEDGYVAFKSRKDDVIISSGYRIGPEEVEETLAEHAAVADAGVIGVPHDERGEVVKAYVVLAEDAEPSEDLRTELQQFVKDRLAKYEYPRRLEFIDDLPTTATGKVRRRDLRTREDAAE